MANPKTGDLRNEIMQWIHSHRDAERKEEERLKDEMKERALADMRRQYMIQAQQIQMPTYHNPYIPRGGWYDDDADKKHKQDALKEKITKLSAVGAEKLSKPGPDYIQTLTGWRGWTIRDEKLAALGDSSKVWKPKSTASARCSSGGQHKSPAKDCKCGYWSFRSMELLTEALRSYGDNVCVVGSVEIWGRVVECVNGFRSEFAYPKELWLLKPDLQHLSWTYGVPVRTL